MATTLSNNPKETGEPVVKRDWEAILRSWVKPPRDNEDTKRNKTENEIKNALSESPLLKSVGYKVYAKGSYANNTNVRLDYDVDIAVEYYGYFYPEFAFGLKGMSSSQVGLVDADDPY